MDPIMDEIPIQIQAYKLAFEEQASQGGSIFVGQSFKEKATVCSHSDWVAPAFSVSKPNGDWHLISDLRTCRGMM
jgi:hypothetical protein